MSSEARRKSQWCKTSGWPKWATGQHASQKSARKNWMYTHCSWLNQVRDQEAIYMILPIVVLQAKPCFVAPDHADQPFQWGPAYSLWLKRTGHHGHQFSFYLFILFRPLTRDIHTHTRHTTPKKNISGTKEPFLGSHWRPVQGAHAWGHLTCRMASCQFIVKPMAQELRFDTI